MPAFTTSSALAISAPAFLARLDLASVNAELAPWVRMTAPAQWQAVPLREWPVGQRLFDSWVLLFGVLPVDRHFFFLERVDPAWGFDERSSSAMNRRWHHTRSVTPLGGGCTVTDRVEYASRLPLLDWLLLPVYRAIFAARHRHLRRRFTSP